MYELWLNANTWEEAGNKLKNERDTLKEKFLSDGKKMIVSKLKKMDFF
jgi:hypothetical protein